MQIITNREFLNATDIIDKYPYKFVIVGFRKEDVLEGCPICTCDTSKEATDIYDSNFKGFPASLGLKDFCDYLILPGAYSNGEISVE